MAEKEIETIEVITAEQIAELDEGLQENVTMIVDHMGERSLLPFNPLISRFQDIAKYRKLKYKKTDKGDNSQEYTDAWREIRSFRADVKKTKKLLKKDILEVGRAIDGIEKAFVDEATNIMDDLQSNFSEYLEEKERKKREAEEKKELERMAEIRKAQEEQDQARKQMQTQEVFNEFKFDVILEAKNSIMQHMFTWNLDHLQSEYDTWVIKTFENEISQPFAEKLSVLSPEQMSSLRQAFIDSRETILRVLKGQISVEKAKDAQKGELPPQAASLQPGTGVSDVPPPPTVTFKNRDELLDWVVDQLADVGNKVEATDQFNEDHLFQQIVGMMDRAIEYINSKR